MALNDTTSIKAAAILQSGVSSVSDDFVDNAQKFVASSIPKDIIRWAASETVPGTDGGSDSTNDITLPVGTDNIISTRRGSFHASEIPVERKGFLGNSDSLHKPTNSFPKYYIAAGNIVRVKPDPDATDEAYVEYVNFDNLGDDSDLSSVVTSHVVAQCFFQLAKEITPSSPTKKVPPPTVEAPSFGSALTIDSSPPVLPSISSQSITLPSNIPQYIAPVFSPPTLTATDPEYTKPVVAPNYSDADSWINTEEDSEMAGARLNEIQARLGQYQADIQNETAEYQKEQQVWANKLQEYNTKYTQYLAEYQSNIQNNLNTFQKESKQYDAEVQESLQEAQLLDKHEDRKIQNFTADLSLYTQNISKEVQDYQSTLTKENQEYQSKIAKFNADLASYQAQVAEEQQDFATRMSKVQLYITSAMQYFQNCINEINNYVSNNSTMISAGINTRRSDAQQQRR
tara:strand:+ start:94 stop:1464 length:1371 start_codon:yes stop_codon:yes gene_type:complete